MHVHYESANPNENPKRYFEADLIEPFTAFSYLNDNNDLENYWPIVHLIVERLIHKKC